MSGSRRPAFTIVELLVVIGIIGVLVAMLLPAVSRATLRAKKAEEANRIRQVGIAWNLYANGNDDAALPGFLEAGNGTEQAPDNTMGLEGWKVHYKLPDGENVHYEDAEEWPWRLMPYLDYDHEVVLGYLELRETSELAMADYTNPDPDGEFRPTKIAEIPAFGYNAYYTGGWWEMEDFGGQMRPRPKFHGAKRIDENGTPTEMPVSVVAMSPSSIADTSHYVIFCSTTEAPPGNYGGFDDFRSGYHLAVPSYLAEDQQWDWGRRRPNDPGSDRTQFVIEAMTDTAIPIARYTNQTTVLYADGHIAPQTPGSLRDQRFWINAADDKDFTHTEF